MLEIGKLVRVRIPGESFWAKVLEVKPIIKAKLLNQTIDDDWSWGEIVELEHVPDKLFNVLKLYGKIDETKEAL